MGDANGQAALRAFGQYRLIRKLATGGMAEIFLAKQLGPQGFERDVVIKRLRPELYERDDFLSMFLDEARLAARLSHPNVVQIHDLGLIERHYFICMEYLAGEDFGVLIRTARKAELEVPITLAARVIAQAAHGLHYAHDLADENGSPLNIVHRDVSPSNLFVTYQGNVKVLDFGIARAESRLTNTEGGKLKGKTSYVAPEQAQGLPADRRSDIYMLGLTLYEALTGIQPFTAENPLKVLKSVLAGNVVRVRELRPEVPEALEEIVHRAMALDPEARFQTAAELAAALEMYLADFTTSTANAELRAWMRLLLGEERIRSRSFLPSLATLQARGVRISGFTDPNVPTPSIASVAPAPRPPEARGGEATGIVGPPASVVAAATRSTENTASLGRTTTSASAAGPVSRVRPWHVGAIAAAIMVLGGTVAALIVSDSSAEASGAPPVQAVVAPTTPAPSKHLVRVECDVPDATVELDGEPRGSCPLQLELESGTYGVAAVFGDRRAVRELALTGEGSNVVVMLSLPSEFPALAISPEPIARPAVAPAPKRRPQATGRVTLDTVPWTRVYVGQKLLGDTPVVEAVLPAGRHTLRLVNEEKGIRQTITIDVEPERTTTRKIKL